MRMLVSAVLVALLVFAGWGPAFATSEPTLKDLIGYTQLVGELGESLPTAAKVKVTQVEAYSGGGYAPNPAGEEFTDKNLTAMSGTYPYSGHATTVAKYFFGNDTSMAPGITTIENYEAGHWLGTGFLNYGILGQPQASDSRVANHSYKGTYVDSISVLKRLDWLIDRDEYIQVVAMNNGSSNEPLLGSSFNAITVGRSDGNHATGAVDLNSLPYDEGRTRPDLVAPLGATSDATPVVASAAALLVGVGHQGGTTLSTDPVSQSTTNRAGATIFNAERSEVVKAVLMAGADHTVIQGYAATTVNSLNGLSSTYGAGQLDVYQSYHIVAAGEQNSLEDFSSGAGHILARGFDYDPEFGGSDGSNWKASYSFHTLTSGSLSASLVWNLSVGTDELFDYTSVLYRLGLYLYDETDSSSSELKSSTSEVDNTQNIWWTGLEADHDYLLKVMAEQADFLWDYGLAWNITTSPVPLPPTVWLLGSALVGLLFLRRRRKP